MVLCRIHERLLYHTILILLQIREDVYFSLIVPNDRQLRVSLLISNEEEPTAEFGSERDGCIITRWYHECTKAVVKAKAAVCLHICTSSRHKSSFSRHIYKYVFRFLDAVASQFLQNSANRVRCANLCHACNFRLIFLIFSMLHDTFILVTYGPLLGRYNRILIGHSGFNYLIKIPPIKNWNV